MQPNLEKQLLSVKEVAAMLGIGVSTIWRQVDLDKFPKPIKIGRATRWRKADIEEIYAPEAA